ISSYCLPMRICSFIMPWRDSRLIKYHSAVLANGYITRYFMRVSANGSISCAERTFVYCDGRVNPQDESNCDTAWLPLPDFRRKPKQCMDRRLLGRTIPMHRLWYLCSGIYLQFS